MKRIGILSLSFNNYGTRLQSYALCKVLKQQMQSDVEIEVIDIEDTWTNRNQSPFVLGKKYLRSDGIGSLLRAFSKNVPRCPCQNACRNGCTDTGTEFQLRMEN